MSPLARIFALPVHAYRLIFSPWVGFNCRYHPTCSAYALEALAEHGVVSDTSTANFVLARFADRAQAEACDSHLQAQGLIVRRVAGYNLPHCLRITVGDEPSCRRVAHAVGQFMGDEA